MDLDTGGFGEATTLVTASTPPLDYYLILAESTGGEPTARPEGIVVEEFVLAEDHSTVGLHTAGWAPADGTWWSSATISRAMRVDPKLRARVLGASRADTARAYHRLGGGELPDEAVLRTHFHDYAALSGSAPLLLGPLDVPDGFVDKRTYRILFAKELSAEGLANLRARWQMPPTADSADADARVLGTARLRMSGDLFSWELRRIGLDVAWCLDVTAYLGGPADDTVGAVLRQLRAAMRGQGLLPVTVERFS